MRCEQKYDCDIQPEKTAIIQPVPLPCKEHNGLHQENGKDAKLNCPQVSAQGQNGAWDQELV